MGGANEAESACSQVGCKSYLEEKGHIAEASCIFNCLGPGLD